LIVAAARRLILHHPPYLLFYLLPQGAAGLGAFNGHSVRERFDKAKRRNHLLSLLGRRVSDRAQKPFDAIGFLRFQGGFLQANRIHKPKVIDRKMGSELKRLVAQKALAQGVSLTTDLPFPTGALRRIARSLNKALRGPKDCGFRRRQRRGRRAEQQG